jgi:putative DNA primase/helicase
VAALKGARFVAAAEVEQGRVLAESKVKQLTGSDTVTARFLYSEPFDFKPEFKLWLSTNNKPVIRGTDDAIWDRIRLIPFTRRFEGANADSRLPEKLREELPGVLAWMVRGCLEWRKDGLGEPERVAPPRRRTTGARWTPWRRSLKIGA